MDEIPSEGKIGPVGSVLLLVRQVLILAKSGSVQSQLVF